MGWCLSGQGSGLQNQCSSVRIRPTPQKKNKKKLDTYCILFVYSVMNCDKCKKIKAVVKYKDGKYCTWYCAKKK